MVKRTRRKSMHKHTRKRVYRRKTSRKKSRHGVKRKMRSTKKHLNRYSKNKFQRGGAVKLHYKKNNVDFDLASGVLTADGSVFGRWNFRLFPGSFTVEHAKRRAKKGVRAISIRQEERPRFLADSYHYNSKITIIFDGDTAAEDEQKLHVELVGFSVSHDEHKFLDLAKNYKWEEVEVALSVNPGLVNVQTSGRWSALHQAVHQGNAALKMGSAKGQAGAAAAATAKRAIEMLVRHGADPNLANTSAKGTPISLAQSEEIKPLLRPAATETWVGGLRSAAEPVGLGEPALAPASGLGARDPIYCGKAEMTGRPPAGCKDMDRGPPPKKKGMAKAAAPLAQAAPSASAQAASAMAPSELYATVRATTGDDVDLLLYNADTTGIPGNLNPNPPTLFAGSVMDDMRQSTEKNQMYVLPSQLNAAEHAQKEAIPNSTMPWLDMYVRDGTGGPRAQLAGDHAIAEYIVDNAATEVNNGPTSNGMSGKPPINYVREILPYFPGKLDLTNGYLGVHDTGNWRKKDFDTLKKLAMEGETAVQLLVSKDLPVSGYDRTLSSKPKYENKTVNLAYASAVPINTYGNDNTAATKTVANIIMVAQYTAALKAAIDLGVQELFLMPLGGGVFHNDRGDIVKNIMTALKKVDLSGTPLAEPNAVKLLTFKLHAEDETGQFRIILSKL